MHFRSRIAGFAVALALPIGAVPAEAQQQTTGSPGSPSATTTIDGRYLPPQPQPFGGEINPSAKESKPYWPARVVPPKGAPNVLLIMTDDAGFGVAGTFGGVVPTPALDRVAAMGLRYTQFHSTALCSPTRAALITGRNHHSVGFGVVAEQATGFPGYDSIIEPNNATIGAILKQNGYSTSWFGKNHNTPSYQYSAAGPFEQWPSGMGFEYFYGFLGGDSSQWQPYLFRNHTQVFPWVGKPGYNLITDMADDAINYMRQLNATAPEKPFLVHYTPGATHAPHHPPPEWIEKFKGKFDGGWNAMREEIFANQKRLGVIPKDAELTAWPDVLPKWDTLSAEAKKLFAHQAEVFAAYAAYNDHEIGRVIQAVEDMGKLDNTLIIYINGDNGTSAEGGLHGTFNEAITLQGIDLPVAEQMKFYDVWGSDKTYPHMAAAWSLAFDTPFQWMKQVASHFGGTRQGMAIAWPARIKDKGGIRTQFHHMIDIVPTILEAAGIEQPQMVNGIAQKPIEGVSMAYTWDKENADAPSQRTTQYFEMFGNRAIYHNGWIASTTPPSPPWLMGKAELPEVVNGYKWELYDMSRDFSQAHDLAAAEPEKLRDMKERFLIEATKYEVFPLDNSILARILTPRPSATAGRNEFTYSGEIAGIPSTDSPSILNRGYSIAADLVVPQNGGDGMIVTQGGRFGGFGLYMLKGKPVYAYNLLGLDVFRWEAPQALAAGKHSVVFEFEPEGPGFGKGGTGVLKVDGQEASRQKIPRSVPFIMPWDETFDVGIDTRTSVDERNYQVPFRFQGAIDKVTFKLREPQINPEETGGIPEKATAK